MREVFSRRLISQNGNALGQFRLVVPRESFASVESGQIYPLSHEGKLVLKSGIQWENLTVNDQAEKFGAKSAFSDQCVLVKTIQCLSAKAR